MEKNWQQAFFFLYFFYVYLGQWAQHHGILSKGLNFQKEINIEDTIVWLEHICSSTRQNRAPLCTKRKDKYFKFLLPFFSLHSVGEDREVQSLKTKWCCTSVLEKLYYNQVKPSVDCNLHGFTYKVQNRGE